MSTLDPHRFGKLDEDLCYHGAERLPAAERRLTVTPICGSNRCFPYKNVFIPHVARAVASRFAAESGHPLYGSE